MTMRRFVRSLPPKRSENAVARISRTSARSSRLMVASGDDDTGHISFDDLHDRLCVRRNGILLNSKIRRPLAAFAVSTLEVVDEAELLELGDDGLEAALMEAMETDKISNVYVRQLQAWAAPITPGKGIPASSAKTRSAIRTWPSKEGWPGGGCCDRWIRRR